ncbi:MAG TPA: hypothetical protein VK846_18675 [Candidatus Limnocylindria bacterium]|nr:hypothetical protein [Candidatus Limnocylindria bacterium]
MKRMATHWAVFVASVFLSVRCIHAQRPPQSIATAPHQYSRAEVRDGLKIRFGTAPNALSIRRNSAGNELFCVRRDASGRSVIFAASESTNRSFQSPGAIAYLDDESKIAAWSDDLKQGVQFIGGQTIKLPLFALFDVDPSGQYFVIGEKPSSAWLGRVQSPEQRTCVSTNILAQRVFVRDGQILLAGSEYRDDNGRIKYTAVCLVIEAKQDRYKVLKKIEFDWAGAVLDVDPFSKRFLLSDKSDMFPTLFLFDESAGRKTKVAKLKDFVFFLKSDLLKR